MRAPTARPAIALLVAALAVLGQGCSMPSSDATDGDDGTRGADAGMTCPQVPCQDTLRCVRGRCLDPERDCIDADNDGYGANCVLGPDCDDDDPARSPGAIEVCGDGLDNDCGDGADEPEDCDTCEPECEIGETFCSGPGIVACVAVDGCPRVGDPEDCPDELSCRDGECVETCVDRDGDGVTPDCDRPADCDDARGDVFPGAAEICDGADNNCDRRVDEGFVCDEPCEDQCTRGDAVCSADARGSVTCAAGPDGCTRWGGTVPCGADRSCDDGVCVERVVCVDSDGDGFGPGCDAGEDCRPADPAARPGASERCNGVDDDCDGEVDEACTPCEAVPANDPLVLTPGVPVHRTACATEEYFAIDGIPAATTVSVAAFPSDTDTEVEVALGRLVDGRFTSDAEGFSLGAVEALVAPWPSGDAARIRIGVPSGTAYSIVVAADEAGAGCTDDPFEPNEGPTFAPSTGSGPFAFAGTKCPTDIDFFAVPAEPGEIIAASAVFDEEEDGDLIVTLWRDGAEVTPTFAGPAGAGGRPLGRHAFYRADRPGRYAVGVRGLARGFANEYALAVQTLGDTRCDDDRFDAGDEHDDSIATASSLARRAERSAVLCAGDYDFISLGTLAAGERVAAELRHGEDGNLDAIMVRDALTHLVQDRRTDGTVERFDNNISSPGEYFIVVFGRTPRDASSYTLSFRVE